jgi:superfamily II DNA or RNA helicase
MEGTIYMEELNAQFIKSEIARTETIFNRGETIFQLGSYSLADKNEEKNKFTYVFDGTYGDYKVNITLNNNKVSTSCSCPFPHKGCKHTVAACLDLAYKIKRKAELGEQTAIPHEYLTTEEIKEQALEGRIHSAKNEGFHLLAGETYKGEHVVKNNRGKEYRVTIYNPVAQSGHCTCPDFATNHMGTCKHLLFTYLKLQKDKGMTEQVQAETFPYVHLTWNSRLSKPCCYFERIEEEELKEKLGDLFNEKGVYTKKDVLPLYRLFTMANDNEFLRFDSRLVQKLDDILFEKELAKLEKKYVEDFSFLKASLYPYQKEGINFALFKKASIIADEMGLGKTLQAICIAILKKKVFQFSKVIIICPTSLKEQWKREIEKYTDENAVIVAGGKKQRQFIYENSGAFFKITNYEAVLRDMPDIARWEPELVILDEAQRIKNFETKTHQAIQCLPRKHSVVITGTPLENKLEDLYSVVQFSNPELLTPLWVFAANHFNLSTQKKNKVLGYKNLDLLRDKLQTLIIRRKKEDVFDCLPEQIVNNYYIDLTYEQREIHQGLMQTLSSFLRKKILTPMDIKKIQMILLNMRMVCNSTYLIDKKTNFSPKLQELVSILKDLTIANNRKVIIFSEWTTMTYLIGKAVSELNLDFVEFTGKIPVEKRQALVEEFRQNPACMVFLATDAGGVGLNLQNADCVINFEMPWNPARLNQRVGRVNRIGQKSTKVNVVNLIARHSIEEKVLAGVHLKQELFNAVFEGGTDTVDFSDESKTKFLNQIRALFGEELEAPEQTNKACAPELEEETPHFLNPQILKDTEPEFDLGKEEYDEGDDPVTESPKGGMQPGETEQLENVLNQGLAFLNGLTQMATGKALVEDTNKKALEINRETGEVVLRFKLPGF